MQDLNDLYYYVQVVEHGGFAPAGRALEMPKSKLSRRIALLEERLGVRLLHRTSRKFSMTEIGQAYYNRCKAVLIEADAAQSLVDATHLEPCGAVSISCPIALLHALVGPMLVRFAQEYPKVTVHLTGMNRPVDVLAEGVDIALRVRPLPLQDSDLALRVLAYARQCLVASPRLVAHQGLPKSPASLVDWPSLGYGPPAGGHSWQLFGQEGAEVTLHHTPRFVTTDMVTLRQAALSGLGVVHLPRLMVQEQLQNGSLIQVLPEWELPREVIHAVFPTRRGLASAVRGLIDHLVSEFEALEDDRGATHQP